MPTILKNDNQPKRHSTLVHSSRETTYKYIKHKKLLLKSHPQFNEKCVQEKIAEDPSILGNGELIRKDKERNQPGAGRLDLLLQDPASNLRYEVEMQLGKTDERHIVRTIEYWDLESKRYPQYDHVAVLIAEDITSRFLTIISLRLWQLPRPWRILHSSNRQQQYSIELTARLVLATRARLHYGQKAIHFSVDIYL